ISIAVSTMTEATAPPTPAKLLGSLVGFKASSAKNSAQRVVRSAPLSAKKYVVTGRPLRSRTAARKTGRIIPSSHNRHEPSIRINARSFLDGDVARHAAGVLGVCSFRPRHDICLRIAHKQLLARDANELAAMAVYLVRMGFDPVPVALELLR